MTTSTQALLKLLPILARQRGLKLVWEYSETLAWIILSAPQGKELAITFRAGTYRINSREGYKGVGYIPALSQEKTTKGCLKAIRIYLQQGYEALFNDMLRQRCASKEPGIPFEDVMKRLNRRRKTVRKTKPQSLEIPPSLKEQVAEKLPADLRALFDKIKQVTEKQNPKKKAPSPCKSSPAKPPKENRK